MNLGDANKVGLVFFAFAGAVVSQWLVAGIEVAAQAINDGQGIAQRLRAQVSLVVRRGLLRSIVPIGLAALVFCIVVFGIGDCLIQSLSLGLALLLAISYLSVLPRPSVVPLSWSVLYGAYFAGIMYVDRCRFVSQRPELLPEAIRVVVQSIVVIGTVLGVCMTILWTMNPRNLQGVRFPAGSDLDFEEINIYRGLWAFYMLTLFLFVLAAVAVWLGVPLMRCMGITSRSGA